MELVKILGRSCSTRLARFPSFFAFSYIFLASFFSWMVPLIILSFIIIVILFTAALAGSGKTYIASIGSSESLVKT